MRRTVQTQRTLPKTLQRMSCSGLPVALPMKASIYIFQRPIHEPRLMLKFVNMYVLNVTPQHASLLNTQHSTMPGSKWRSLLTRTIAPFRVASTVPPTTQQNRLSTVAVTPRPLSHPNSPESEPQSHSITDAAACLSSQVSDSHPEETLSPPVSNHLVVMLNSQY